MKTFAFIGRKYDESNNVIEEKKFGPQRFESISHAEVWFLSNYPDYYFGGNIKQMNVKNPDFVCVPVPSYYKEFYDTDNMAYIVVKELEYLKSLIK